MASPRLHDNKGNTHAEGQETLGVYTGRVSAAGVLSNAPSGWEVDGPTSNVFTVTHNLGLTADSYEVFCQVHGSTKGAALVKTTAANEFTVETSDLATPSGADLAFSFRLVEGDGE